MCGLSPPQRKDQEGFKAFHKITGQKGLVVELTTKLPLLKHLGSLLEDLYKQLPGIKKDLLLDRLFFHCATDLGIDSNPGDYANLPMKAMLKLQEKGKLHLVYKWSRRLYNEELEGKPSLDFDRMPFGLKNCRELSCAKRVVELRVLPEPNNIRDCNALIIQAKIENQWERIGYIPKEKVPKFTSAIRNIELKDVKFRNIKCQYVMLDTPVCSFFFFCCISYCHQDWEMASK